MAQTKKCFSCKNELPTSEFGFRSRNKDKLQNKCRDCTAKYDKAYYEKQGGASLKRRTQGKVWRAARLAEFNLRFKEGKICTDCKTSFHHSAMQFDHLYDKTFTIGEKKTSLSWSELEAEIAKCEIVCANCHSVRTYNRINALASGTGGEPTKITC